jgi:hypothetical protein
LRSSGLIPNPSKNTRNGETGEDEDENHVVKANQGQSSLIKVNQGKKFTKVFRALVADQRHKPVIPSYLTPKYGSDCNGKPSGSV